MCFRDFVIQNFPFLEDDFDALTDYELFCKMVEYMRKALEDVDSFQTQLTAFNQELDYYENYFNNLDLQEEVDHKLDEMAESGELTDIIAQYLGLAGMITFDTVSDMRLAENLVNGSKCATLGFYNVNDGGHALYKIRNITNDDVVNNITIIALDNPLLVAELIKEEYANAKQYGFKSDGTDNTSIASILFANNKVLFDDNTYIFSNVNIDHDIEIIGNNTTIKPTRTSNDNNRYNTLFSISNDANVKIKDINFEGYVDVVTQTGTIPASNSLIIADACNNIKVENCTFNNFDGTYSSSVPTLMTDRRATLFTIHDTLKTIFDNNTFSNIKGNEMIYCIDNELERTQINLDFINNKIINIYTTALDFIGNIANIKNNCYNFEYAGSCLNVFALYLFVENDEINGQYDNVYDNCEELYFRGINANINNVINNANVTNTIVHLSAENCVINNLINNNDQTMNCVRNYFGTNSSNIHKDCTSTIIPKTITFISNSKMIAKHCVTSYNTSSTDYNLIIENCELKSSLNANTWLIATAPFELTLLNNIIHLCVTAGSGAPTVIYSRSDNILKLLKATNNKIINDTESQQRFIVGTLPDFIAFIGNTTNKANSIIAADLTNVKAYGNYNYNES